MWLNRPNNCFVLLIKLRLLSKV